MKEQSHKSEMRAALEGDFERLRARREDVGGPVAVAPPLGEQGLGPEAAQPDEVILTAPAAPEPEPVRSSWLDRLRDRR